MKKYLREIEISGLILMVIGFFITIFLGANYGAWPCVAGILLWLVTFLYKAFHWTEYARENRQNIIILIGAIILLFIQMIKRL